MKNSKEIFLSYLKNWKLKFPRYLSLGIWILPSWAFAHEVYVLPPDVVAQSIARPSFNMMSAVMDNFSLFLFWTFVALVVSSTILFISVFRFFEERMAPAFTRIKSFAPAVARITVGIGFISVGYHQAIFGPELPFMSIFGMYSDFVSVSLFIVGSLIAVGFWARAAALVGLTFFAMSTYYYGAYMLTYASYFGEMIVLLLIGSHRASVHSLTGLSEKFHRSYHLFADKIKHLAFPILRVTFGLSLMYSSLYAKILHNNLALHVASTPLGGHEYPIAYYFGFEPQFLVLGAAIIELVMGIFFVFGIAIRWNSIFLLFWLALSLWYFGESVWPHIVLIGLPIAFIMHGYDKYSFEGYFLKKGRREPVL